MSEDTSGHTLIHEAEGTTIYVRTPHMRSLRFEDAETVRGYVSFSNAIIPVFMVEVVVCLMLRLFGVDEGTLFDLVVAFQYVGVVVYLIASHRMFAGRVVRMSWEESVQVAPTSHGEDLNPWQSLGAGACFLIAGAALCVLMTWKSSNEGLPLSLLGLGVGLMCIGAFLVNVGFNAWRFREHCRAKMPG